MDRDAGGQADGNMDKQAARQTDGNINRLTERQRGRQKNGHKDI